MKNSADRTRYSVVFLIAVASLFYAGAAYAAGYAILPLPWSDWIQESGKSGSGHSEYICADSSILIGRQHKGDENGDTRYMCGTVSYNGFPLTFPSNAGSGTNGQWSSNMKEANSNYTCPVNTVMTGRRHWGDENGDTSYLCVAVTFSGNFTAIFQAGWQSPIQESGKNSGGTSSFQCPSNQMMIGRQHDGDENGDTRYRCGKFVADTSPTVFGAPNVSAPIQESGKSGDGTSSYTCPANMLMGGREHDGDENGDTRYTCFAGESQGIGFVTVSTGWGSWIQESGKSSGGTSAFACPGNQFMIGREHKGDENGDTRYKCALTVVQGVAANWGQPVWSDWIEESSSNYTCPTNAAMVSREHKGDENGNTRYQCAPVNVRYMPSTLTAAYELADDAVGTPATTNPSQFASRDTMKVNEDFFIHLDAGGEGYHLSGGAERGFAGAININAKMDDSQPPHALIPYLIFVNTWTETSPPYPFADATANYITMQSAPLYPYFVDEIARVIAPGGKVGLWIADINDPEIQSLADRLGSTVTISGVDASCVDEFDGKAGYPKACLTNSN